MQSRGRRGSPSCSAMLHFKSHSHINTHFQFHKETTDGKPDSAQFSSVVTFSVAPMNLKYLQKNFKKTYFKPQILRYITVN